MERANFSLLKEPDASECCRACEDSAQQDVTIASGARSDHHTFNMLVPRPLTCSIAQDGAASYLAHKAQDDGDQGALATRLLRGLHGPIEGRRCRWSRALWAYQWPAGAYQREQEVVHDQQVRLPHLQADGHRLACRSVFVRCDEGPPAQGWQGRSARRSCQRTATAVAGGAEARASRACGEHGCGHNARALQGAAALPGDADALPAIFCAQHGRQWSRQSADGIFAAFAQAAPQACPAEGAGYSR
eukprot:1772209-Pleurochrysis_carterae.AAC.1